jgi:hypothetical protein
VLTRAHALHKGPVTTNPLGEFCRRDGI